jgi:DegV family protein with EDD domain
MAKVAVVTDSTHYLPREIIARHRILEVPLYVGVNGSSVRETEIGDLEGFYRGLADFDGLPHTSQPSVGDFLVVYEPLLEDGFDVLSIHLSGGISGTVRVAEQARDQLIELGAEPPRILVVDSGTACAPLGLLAIAAANAVQRGGDLQTAVRAAHELGATQNIVFAVDTLEYLRRGGRIGTAQAWLGSALKIKPILTLDHEIKPIERVRTSKRAFERLVDHLRERHESGCDAWIVQHIRAAEQAELLAKRGREIFGSDPEFISEIGPVIGSHIGPGLLGASGWPRELIGQI